MTSGGKNGIYEKLADAISDVERIGKDGKNQHFKYTYTSAEQVYRVIRGPLLDHGLVVIPEAVDYNTAGDLGTVKLRLRIVDTETGETIEAQWFGEGQDKGDKAVYKAVTGGMKTWLKHLFLLPADDDPEADPATDKAPAKADPMGRLRELIGDSGLTKEEMASVGKWVKPNGKVLQDRLTKAVHLLESGKAGELAKAASA
jgi:hypothetical protein